MSTPTGTCALLALSAALVLRRLLTGLIARRKIPEILKQGAQIVDVRSPGANVLDPNRWVVVCCASGTRSGMARRQLLRQGFRHVLNAGFWRNLPQKRTAPST